MNTKILISLLALAFFSSCGAVKNDKHEENGHEESGHEENRPEGFVVLNKQQQDALKLTLGNFQMRNLTTVVKTNGKLEVAPSAKADITALIGGNVKKIKVFHGDKVRKGQLLAVLEHPDYITLQEDFAEIANQLDFAEKDYARQKELFENNIGSGKDFQKAKTTYNSLKARFSGSKSRLQLLRLSPEEVKAGKISSIINIVSPITGYINEINIKIGTYVDAKDKLFAITDNNAIHADFMIYERDVHLVKEGQKIHFTVSNRPGEELTANVFAIGKEFEPNTRSVHIHAKINEQTKGLVPGMYISGHLHADEHYTRTLPNDAVVDEGTKSFIFVLDTQSLSEKDNHPEHQTNEDNHDDHTGSEADEHDHGDHAAHDVEEENHEENHEEKDLMAFKMVEVIKGKNVDGYTEIMLIDSLAEESQIVINAAYYLLADMKKEETEHNH